MASALFLTSCGGDDEEDGTPDVTKPTFDFTASSEVKNGETISVAPNEPVTIIVTGSKVDKNLKEVSFYEGENLITVTTSNGRLTIDGEIQNENPVDISNDDNENFTWTILLKAASTEGANNYKIVLEDNDELRSELSFTIVTTLSDMNEGVKLYSSLASADAAKTIGAFYAVESNTTGTSDAFVASSNEADVDFGFMETGTNVYSLAQPGNVTVKPNFTKTTMFGTSGLTFSTATRAQISDESPSATSVSISAGKVYSFYNSTTNTKGLIQVVSIDANDLMTFNVKFIETIL